MKVIYFVCLYFFSFLSLYAAPIVVKVGGYHFPPYIVQKNTDVSGIAIEMIKILNKIQSDYKFEFILTSSNRRYIDFTNDNFDLMFFENKVWGWQNYSVSNSSIFALGGEVYITKADVSKDQSYFENFEGKKIVGFLGYHYGFSNFNSDPIYLLQNHNARMTRSHEGNIYSILKNRFDIAIVTEDFLAGFLREHPNLKAELLISKKMDQKYENRILFKTNGKLSADTIENLLSSLNRNKEYQALLASYSIKVGLKK